VLPEGRTGQKQMEVAALGILDTHGLAGAENVEFKGTGARQGGPSSRCKSNKLTPQSSPGKHTP
jgi:hypothetical protein